jgi:hypothetical protein
MTTQQYAIQIGDSERMGRAPLAHVPAKWPPVRRQEHAPMKESRAWNTLEAGMAA